MTKYTALVYCVVMRLKDYIQNKGLTYEEFAQQIGVTETSVYRYVAGLYRPASYVLDRIKEATDGAVMANDFYHTPAASSEASK